jgi:osmotically-inducible protein OsmY
MPADLELAAKIRDKLAATRRDLTQIAIQVIDGNVHLRGPVASYHLRQVAIDRARRVPGVREITDEIRVDDY